MKSFPTIGTRLDSNLMSDAVMDDSHDWRRFRELRMGLTPVRKLSFAKATKALFAAELEDEKEISKKSFA